jgi:hypothetical protein
MPSHLHEAQLRLFQNRPTLAPVLLRSALHVEVPEFTAALLQSADFTQIEPAEYRADLVVVLKDDEGEPAMGIIVEVQRSTHRRKKFTWPVYAVTLRARFECPVCVLVVAADENVAEWAAEAVDIGCRNFFAPLVLRPSAVPVVTDPEQAIAVPELAVLSAIAHGQDADANTSVRIVLAAQAAIAGLDEERARPYYDLVLSSLSDTAREALNTMDLKTYEYQSDFARHYHSQGIEEGRVEGHARGIAEGERRGEQRGRAELVMRQLKIRFGSLPSELQTVVNDAPIAELDAIAERLLTAPTLEEAMSGTARADI